MSGDAGIVLLTDHPWPDLDIERSLFAAAGLELVAGPVRAPSGDEVARRAATVDPRAIMTCWAPVSAEAISAPGHLAVVARLGVGLDNIAVEAATARGAWVTNVPDYCVGEVSDHAVAMLLAGMRGLTTLDRAAKAGRWAPEAARLSRIADLTVGIIGYGRIGQLTARKLQAFGCRVLVHSRSPRPPDAPFEAVPLDAIQRECDAIILHAPLTTETHSLVNKAFLAACARQPYLINVSRGALVDNRALLEALERGKIRGAALDVIDGEPDVPSSILRHEAILVTPHIAFSSLASVRELRTRACEDVVRALSGERPVHPCNEPGRALEGGVASDIRLVETLSGPQVVKHALTKLRVREEWLSSPNRSSTEVAALRAARDLIGDDAVPAVLWGDPSANTFGMAYVGPPFQNWKSQLLRGEASALVAGEAAAMLAALHLKSSVRADLAERFADITNFEELRLEPFFRRMADRRPDLAPAIIRAGEGLLTRRSALVHGDYSPKNLLTDGRRIVMLDWEVAHWGDPRFDVAFCLTHLILKAHRVQADRRAMLACVDAFIDAYRRTMPSIVDAALTEIIGALLIARLYGTSPVEYTADLKGEQVHRLATTLLGGASPLSARSILDASGD
jgi:D-3-phosphoglycerate dehydrogenase